MKKMITPEDGYAIALRHVPDAVRKEIEAEINLFKAEMSCMVAAIMEAADLAGAMGIEAGAIVEREICADIATKMATGNPKAAEALIAAANAMRIRGASDSERVRNKVVAG